MTVQPCVAIVAIFVLGFLGFARLCIKHKAGDFFEWWLRVGHRQ